MFSCADASSAHTAAMRNPLRLLISLATIALPGMAQAAAGDPAVKAGRLVIDARPWMSFKGMLK